MVIAADSGEPRTSVWLTVRPAAPASRRSEAPSGLDRERITAAAVRLLDAEGLARFSMRRLAAGLGVTAMSLYWYVDTKHDLLELALDRVLGELAFTPGPAPDVLPAPDGPPGPGGWPGRLRALARAYHRILTEHPWVVPPTAAYPNIGPHAGAFDAALQRLLGATGLTGSARTGAHLAVSQFLHGCGCGCGGAVRPVSEDDFCLALDVLIAGIEAKAPA